jgi:hypothetical protein
MIKNANDKSLAKRIWAKPVLNRLGTIKDVAGPAGSAAQSPIQVRS